MKFLLAKSPDIINRCLKKHNLTAIENTFYCHPTKLEEMVHDFITQEKEQDQGMYITYNISALNIIPEDMILWLEEIAPDTTVIKPFWEVFESWKDLKTGDVFEIICYGVNHDEVNEIMPNEKLLQNGEIKYFVPKKEK